ncbi:Abi family protein [Ursidibacter maritimus]|nr:Abi family protein [Ursidibacter maritimus]KAE9541378.1 hypothetical protein A1D26_00255 [Ursidibacter maritimus]MBV6531035.1 Abi family protein [Ursidibacter maritimus]MBV6536905.1 Abi family protein [Ursidibacter maritimus]MBV6538733.1 Abi family protein [Ursidibacter maritimus]
MTIKLNITHIEPFISTERCETFKEQYPNQYTDKMDAEDILRIEEHNKEKALQLYIWNNQMAGALLSLLGFYEVVLRNAIMKVIDYKYYPYSIFNNQFIFSLSMSTAENFIETINSLIPSTQEPYTLINNTTGTRNNKVNISGIPKGKVVAKMNFGFWEDLLTKKHSSLWKYNYKKAFPYMNSSDTIEKVYDITTSLRKLRNRVCHNEPIFKNNIEQTIKDIRTVLGYVDPILINTINLLTPYLYSLVQERFKQAL